MSADNSSGRAGAPRKRRGKGRPARGSQAVGRDALVDCACRMLQTHPPADVTRAAVARELGVDPSLIRYYFRDRATLLLAAAERLVSEFGAFLQAQHIGVSADAHSKLKARFSALLQLDVTYPHFHRLLIEEIAPLKRAESQRLLQELTARGLREYQAIIDQGAAEKSLRKVEPALLFIAIIGLCQFFVSGAAIVELAMGPKFDRKQTIELYRRFVTDMLLHGLAAPRAEK